MDASKARAAKVYDDDCSVAGGHHVVHHLSEVLLVDGIQLARKDVVLIDAAGSEQREPGHDLASHVPPLCARALLGPAERFQHVAIEENRPAVGRGKALGGKRKVRASSLPERPRGGHGDGDLDFARLVVALGHCSLFGPREAFGAVRVLLKFERHLPPGARVAGIDREAND